MTAASFYFRTFTYLTNYKLPVNFDKFGRPKQFFIQQDQCQVAVLRLLPALYVRYYNNTPMQYRFFAVVKFENFQ